MSTAAGVLELAVVPPGFTWLIKAVHYLNGAGAEAHVQLQLMDPPEQIAARLPLETIASGAAAVWQGWTAAGPGDHVFLITDQGGTHIWIAGAVLPGAV